jgi:ketosteroid isomerase-like protein
MNNVLDAIRLADRWVSAWNARDLPTLLGLYSEDAVFQSPFVTLMSSVTAPALRGKAALAAHFEVSWAVGPRGMMVLEDVHLAETGVTLFVRGGCAPKMVMEFVLDRDGRIVRTVSHVTDNQPRRSA